MKQPERRAWKQRHVRRRSAIVKQLLGAQAAGSVLRLERLPTAKTAIEAYWDTLPGRAFYNLSRADGQALLNMLRDLVGKGAKFGNWLLGVRQSGRSNLGEVVLAATNVVRLRQSPPHLYPFTQKGKKLVLRLHTPHGMFDVLYWLDIRSSANGKELVTVRFQMALPP
jgi:hypothetical protein